MKLAFLLAGILATSDGGHAVEVAKVSSAQAVDGGTTLPEGWWLSNDRMVKVGQALEKSEQQQASPSSSALLISFGLGILVGAGGTIYLWTRLK